MKNKDEIKKTPLRKLTQELRHKSGTRNAFLRTKFRTLANWLGCRPCVVASADAQSHFPIFGSPVTKLPSAALSFYFFCFFFFLVLPSVSWKDLLHAMPPNSRESNRTGSLHRFVKQPRFKRSLKKRCSFLDATSSWRDIVVFFVRGNLVEKVLIKAAGWLLFEMTVDRNHSWMIGINGALWLNTITA